MSHIKITNTDRPRTVAVIVYPPTAADLTAYARRLGLSDEDLAETILDLENDLAAKRVNAGGDFDTEHDDADAAATNVLNGGLNDQVAYLVQTLGPTQARAAIDAVGPPAWSPLRVITRAAA